MELAAQEVREEARDPWKAMKDLKASQKNRQVEEEGEEAHLETKRTYENKSQWKQLLKHTQF